MISYNPIPLLEASFFLANRELKKNSKEYFNSRREAINDIDGRIDEYIDSIIQLEERLEGSITADASTLSMLFKPLDNTTSMGRMPSTLFAANLIVQDIVNYNDGENCFSCLHEKKEFVRSSIANWISHTDKLNSKITTDELFLMLKKSGLSSDAKLLITDIAVDYDNYVNLLEEVLTPVANEFTAASALYAPLIEKFKLSYPQNINIEKVIADSLQNHDFRSKRMSVFPMISYYPHRIVNIRNDCIDIGIGVLYDFLVENYNPNIRTQEKLSNIMTVLGGKNRFNIMMRLAEGPVYGREIAKLLDVAPATVSQHMSLLLGAGLVKLENEGTKVYYSLNSEGMKDFIEMQKELFLKS